MSIFISFQLFINNELVESVSGKRLEVINPATGDIICDVAEADSADVDIAVAAAQRAGAYGSPWRTMNASERGRLMYKLADAIERDIRYIAVSFMRVCQMFSKSNTIPGSRDPG